MKKNNIGVISVRVIAKINGISKFPGFQNDLRVRSIFHQLQRRIEAHICICFVAYKIHKELYRQFKETKPEISANTAIENNQNHLQHYRKYVRWDRI